MRRSPMYVFKDRNAMGIFDIPLKSMIQIVDSDGIGSPDVVQILSKEGLTSGSTIGNFLDNPSLYKDNTPNNMKLTELVDTTTEAPQGGDLLTFDSVTEQWINANGINGGTF